MISAVSLVFLSLLAAEDPPVENELDRAMREAAQAFDTTNAVPSIGQPARIEAVKQETEVNGYVMNRFTGSWVDLKSPAFSSDLPQINNLMEANIQLRRPLWKEAFAYTDVSGFLQQGGWFIGKDANGNRISAPNRDAATLKPILALSELYISYSPHPNVNILVGKRRIVWGPGFANNPTDILNPPRDPSDPNLQRTGAILARVEVPTERVTFSFVAAPQVLYTENGLPYQFLRYPGYMQRNAVQEQLLYPVAGQGGRQFPDTRDTENHFVLAGRVYALVLDSDINFIYYYSNLYNDSYKNKSRFGLTFSRYFFTDWEFHLEALFTEGTQRTYVNGDCVADQAAALGCVVAGKSLFGQTKLDNGVLYPRLLAGVRRAFSDESTLSLEYLWVSDGYTPTEFQNFVRGVTLARQEGFNAQIQQSGSTAGAIVPRFSFDPLRRHYLFLSYTKPKIHDDFTISAVLLANLEDLSGVLIPTAMWNAFEWLNLSLSGFIPIRGIPVNQAHAFGVKYSEYSLFPYDVRVYFEARAYY